MLTFSLFVKTISKRPLNKMAKKAQRSMERASRQSSRASILSRKAEEAMEAESERA
jgi:hypothetical protein